MPRPANKKIVARAGGTTAVISASVEPEAKRQAMANAKARKMSLSKYIEFLIEEDLKRDHDKAIKNRIADPETHLPSGIPKQALQ